MWETVYKHAGNPISAITTEESREPSVYDLLAQSLDVTGSHVIKDEFERFIDAAPQRLAGNPLAWWRREEQRIEYPRLHRMAFDILSIPPMSDEAERVFSGARRTISWDRAKLLGSAIEKTECMKHWIKNGLIRKVCVAIEGDIDVESFIDSDAGDM